MSSRKKLMPMPVVSMKLTRSHACSGSKSASGTEMRSHWPPSIIAISDRGKTSYIPPEAARSACGTDASNEA